MDSFLAWLVTAVPEFNALALATGPGLFLNGSAANPGISFAADPDTGLYRPGANQLAAVTGGVTRWLLSNAGMQIDVPLFGSAVTQSPNDTTAGRLLKTGDFGLGTAISLGATDNLDNILTSGLFYNSASANTTGNNYPLYSAGAVIVVARTPTNVTQKFISHGGNTTASGLREFSRSYGASGWGPWVEMMHQGVLVGTVSQSGGVPTGRSFEPGSNANGVYIRLADGTQICWGRRVQVGLALTQAFHGGYRASYETWTFPAAFSAAPEVCATPLFGSAFGAVANAPSAAGVGFSPTSVSSSLAADRTTSLVAFGRWF
jgi:hypothetical protein